jgi:hypothetical protein
VEEQELDANPMDGIGKAAPPGWPSARFTPRLCLGSSMIDGPGTEWHSAGVNTVRLFGAGEFANFSTALGDETGVETEGRLEMSLRLGAELQPAPSTQDAGSHERVPAAGRQKHTRRLCTRGIQVRGEKSRVLGSTGWRSPRALRGCSH